MIDSLRTIVPALLGVLALAAPAQERNAPQAEPPAKQAASQDAVDAFLKKGIRLDLERRSCSIPVTIGVRDDLLEYVLVSPRGAGHESLFQTEISGIDLNTALVVLGVEPGRNARWIAADPQPTPEEVRAGSEPYVVEPPEGDGFYLYVAWRAQGETYFYRLEDLLRNLETGRAMRRHRWVYLGSRWVKLRQGGAEAFAADVDGNLVNLAFFEQGHTLVTAALPECRKQTIWLPNAWLLPQRGEPVTLVFARERMSALPDDLAASLPEVAEASSDAQGGR